MLFNKIGFCLLFLFVSLATAEIDDQKAMQRIYGNYDVQKKYSEWTEGANKVNVRILTSYRSDDKYYLLTEAAPRDCNSHSCVAVISVATFSKSGNDWKLDSQPMFVAKMGSWGRAPKPDIVKIGPKKYAVCLNPDLPRRVLPQNLW